jgi:putative transposase
VNLNAITAFDQVLATDITYIPPQKELLYPVASMNLDSKHVFKWKLSISRDNGFSFDALEMALSGVRRSELFHSNQRGKFTSSEFMARLQAEQIKIS